MGPFVGINYEMLSEVIECVSKSFFDFNHNYDYTSFSVDKKDLLVGDDVDKLLEIGFATSISTEHNRRSTQ